ncbi:MAG: SCO family protein [Flavobacteriales bacterium]|nr:SCO family protein [Flavobacteriales bacterium]
MKNKLAILIPALILCVGIGVAYVMIKNDRILPIYSPAMINPDLVDESKQKVLKGHTIDNFTLTNQDGETISEKDFDGYYYVTDFFFTTCPTICPSMSTEMQRVQKRFMDDKDFLILSHTVQPEVDSVPVLKEYANLYEANPKKWIFATGDKKVIYDLARKSYFAAVTEGDGGPNDFIHTENFVLVDKKKRIRGFYDGTSSESVDRLMTDIEILSQEYE